MNLWALTIPALIGAIAWLYQKAWERLDRRVKQYEEIIDALPGFTEGGLDAAKINAAIAMTRRLWILAPDNVVQALHAFFHSIENSKGHAESARALGELILAMRRDASLWAVLFPRPGKSHLHADDFRLFSASSAKGHEGTPVIFDPAIMALRPNKSP